MCGTIDPRHTYNEYLVLAQKPGMTVAGRPNPLVGRPGFMSVWPVVSCTRVYSKRGRPRWWRKSVEAEPRG
jgi:hypothetical protein